MAEMWDDTPLTAEQTAAPSKMPLQKKAVVKLTDQELLDAIRKASVTLELAINAALAAGLEVDFKIDASDLVNVSWDKQKVRLIQATAIRRLK